MSEQDEQQGGKMYHGFAETAASELHPETTNSSVYSIKSVTHKRFDKSNRGRQDDTDKWTTRKKPSSRL